MTIDFQSWMRAIWQSILEPSDMARRIVGMDFPRDALWTGLALSAVLNVMLLALLQLLSPAAVVFQDQMFALSPFEYVAMMGIFLVLLVFGTLQAGRVLGGRGTLAQTLTIIVWFQCISLTLEVGQLVLMLISPAIAAIFGLISLGALIWCFVNFVNILHGFQNLAKAIFTILIALIGTAFVAGIVLTVLGIGTPGGMT